MSRFALLAAVRKHAPTCGVHRVCNLLPEQLVAACNVSMLTRGLLLFLCHIPAHDETQSEGWRGAATRTLQQRRQQKHL